MMLQEILTLIPQPAPDGIEKTVIGTGMASCVIGLLMWIVGARFSRQTLTLLLVSLGAIIGKKIPLWYGWNFSPAAFAVGGAIVFGVAGFAMHRLWIGMSLGVITSLWSAFPVWMLRHDQTGWSWPGWSADTSLAEFCRTLWENLPDDVRMMLPYAAGASLISSVVIGLIKPRLATVINWSLWGATLMLVGSIVAIAAYQPEWFAKAPAGLRSQILILAAIVAFGAVVQWKTAPPGRSKLPKATQAG